MSNVQSLSLLSSLFQTQSTSSQQNQSVDGSMFDLLLASFDTSSTSANKNNNVNNTSSIIDALCGNTSASNASDPLAALGGSSTDSSVSSPSDIFSALLSQLTGSTSSTNTDPLTSEFTSTFGSSGPLPDWINLVTAGLHLNSSQNQALQHIAVENKDTTGSQSDIAQIATELTQAGITG